MDFQGIVLLDKAIHITSNRALQQVKRLLNVKKAGHTGCLDPLATGMLPICLGEATKFSQFILNASKTYTVVAQLGATTNTGDCTGVVLEKKPIPPLTFETLLTIVSQFSGERMQIPPMFSALKHHGQPLYQLARQGKTIDRLPRKIMIEAITLTQFEGMQFSLSVRCSKGTYIRVLIEEIGEQIGCGAHVVALRRTQITGYETYPLYTYEQLASRMAGEGAQGLQCCILPIESALQSFALVRLSREESGRFRQGQQILLTLLHEQPHTMVRVMTEEGQFIGIGQWLPGGYLKPYRLLNTLIY